MVISGQLANLNSQKTFLSGKPKGSIKQTNTSQVLVSETVPSRRVQLSREAKTTRFQDNPVSSTVKVPPRRQPGCDTSTRNRRKFRLDVSDPDLQTSESHNRHPVTHPASSQPVSETTTSESSVSLPSSPSSSSCTTSTSTNGTDSSSSETSSESSSQPSSNASSPETTTSASS